MATVVQAEGSYWEQQAMHFLLGQGLRLLTRNFRAPTGEIDLVMLDDRALVFVEVRKRRRSRFQGAAASVDRRKQQRLQRTAALFRRSRPDLSERPVRFDIIAWDTHPHSLPRPQWLRGAITGF